MATAHNHIGVQANGNGWVKPLHYVVNMNEEYRRSLLAGVLTVTPTINTPKNAPWHSAKLASWNRYPFTLY